MKAEKIKVDDASLARLMLDIERGDIRIPRFQRDFVWERRRIQELLDSMYKEYPIGTIFLWKAPPDYNHLLRTVEYLDQPPVDINQRYSFILDGQQRLTSLYAVVKGLTINGEEYGKIVVDLSKRDPDKLFQFREPDNKRWVSIKDLVSNDFHIYDNLSDEYRHEFQRCSDLLRNYPFSMVIVKDMDIGEAIEIFERINRRGRRLSRYDLITASVLTDEFDLRERTKQDVIDRLSDSFGEIPETSIPQAIALNVKGNTEYKTQIELKSEEVQQVWAETTESFMLAVDFVRQNLGVDRVDFLPYDAMLPVLAYYFYHARSHTVKSPQHREQLERWFWRVAFSERYSGASQTRMSEDAAWIRELVTENRPYEQPTTVNLSALTQVSMTYTTSAIRNGVLCLLNLQRPLHFNNATRIQIVGEHFSQFNQAERHHIFPVDFLRSVGYETKDVHLLPNFCFIPAELNKWITNKRPSQYMKELRDSCGHETFERVMRSHLIPIGDNSGIWTDNYERFLKQRAELLMREIRIRCGISDLIPEEHHNPIIDAIEEEIRNLIHTNLGNTFGPDYWDSCIPGDVDQKILERIESYVRKTPGITKQQLEDERARLEFCDISEYPKVILKNWQAFSTIFRSRSEFERTLDDFREFRNVVKHNRSMDKLLEHRAQAAVIWLGRALQLDLSEYDIFPD